MWVTNSITILMRIRTWQVIRIRVFLMVVKVMTKVRVKMTAVLLILITIRIINGDTGIINNNKRHISLFDPYSRKTVIL